MASGQEGRWSGWVGMGEPDPLGPPQCCQGLGPEGIVGTIEAKPPFPRPVSRIVLSPCQRTLPPRVGCPLLRIKVPSTDGPPASLLGRDLLYPSSVLAGRHPARSCPGWGGACSRPSWCMTVGVTLGEGFPGPALLTTNGARWGWEERPASLSPWSYGSESPVCEGWEPFPPEEEHWGTLPVPFTSPAGRTEGS